MAARGIDGLIEQGDSFMSALFPYLKDDYLLANRTSEVKDPSTAWVSVCGGA